jgi:hypothetical protein
MKRFIPVAAALIAVAALSAGCSDSTSPQDTSNVRIEADMASTNVPFGKTVAVSEASGLLGAGATVDSLQITSIQLLIKEIKLESKDSATEIKVKTGPAILSMDQSGPRLATTGTIPAATYDKVQIHFHRFNDQERADFLNSPDYADFLSNDRYSIVIKGTAFDKGQSYPFTFGGKVEEDVKLDMADVSVNSTGVATIVLRIDPVAAFKDLDTRVVYDPRDSANTSKIEGLLKKPIKALKK